MPGYFRERDLLERGKRKLGGKGHLRKLFDWHTYVSSWCGKKEDSWRAKSLPDGWAIVAIVRKNSSASCAATDAFEPSLAF